MSDKVVIDGDMTLTSAIDGEGSAVIRLGQNPVIEPLNVAENGTYEVSDGIDGYSPVTVAIPEYDGVYEVEPSAEMQTLATAGKVMTHDVTVEAPTTETWTFTLDDDTEVTKVVGVYGN